MIHIKHRSPRLPYGLLDGGHMTNANNRFFSPGWDTPIVFDHSNKSFLAWFLRIFDTHKECTMRRQGKCPGLDHCHDCPWSS
jgi:hypothetical protein